MTLFNRPPPHGRSLTSNEMTSLGRDSQPTLDSIESPSWKSLTLVFVVMPNDIITKMAFWDSIYRT